MKTTRIPGRLLEPGVAGTGLIRRALGLCKVLRGWPDDVLEALAAAAWMGHYERHEQLLVNDPQRRDVLVVASGCISVDHVDVSGERFLLSVYGPGDVTSLIRLLADAPFHFSFHARERSSVVHIPGDAMVAVLDAHPILWKDLCLLMLARTQQSIVLQQRRFAGQLTPMVADAVVQLARIHAGTPSARRPAGGVSVAMSQADLAAMLSVSRQTINKELGRLRQLGLLQVRYGRLDIIDFDRLQQLAGHG